MITEDKFVPVGTPVLDQNSQAPVTVRRDYGHGHVPACELDLEGVRKLRSVLDDLEAEILAYMARADEEADRPVCGHEHAIGGTAYTCQRQPHPVDGYGDDFRHAAGIGTELAKGTDEDDGFGPATLVTWGEDGNGDGQDWEVAWGCVAERDATGDGDDS